MVPLETFSTLLMQSIPVFLKTKALDFPVPLKLSVRGLLSFYNIDVRSVTLLDVNGPDLIKLSWAPITSNVLATVENLDVELKIDATVSAAWLVPVTIERIKLYNLNLEVEISGRKNDPE